MHPKLVWALIGAGALLTVELTFGSIVLFGVLLAVRNGHPVVAVSPTPSSRGVVVPSPTPLAYANRFREYPIPSPGGTPYALTLTPDGSVWFSEAECTSGIGRRSQDGSWSHWPITGGCNSQPLAITRGPDGNVWFADVWGFYGRVTSTGEITRFKMPEASYPLGITTGPDGNLWVAAGSPYSKPFIAQVSPSGLFLAKFPINTKAGEARGIVTGPDRALWFTESAAIGRLTTSGQLTEFPLPQGTGSGMPYQIAAGPDGHVWFVEYTAGGGGRIGRMSLNGQLTEFEAPFGGLQWITVGPDKALWFTGAGSIGRMTTSGIATAYSIPTYRAQPVGIITGPDGNMWFAENFGDGTGTLGVFKLR